MNIPSPQHFEVVSSQLVGRQCRSIQRHGAARHGKAAGVTPVDGRCMLAAAPSARPSVCRSVRRAVLHRAVPCSTYRVDIGAHIGRHRIVTVSVASSDITSSRAELLDRIIVAVIVVAVVLVEYSCYRSPCRLQCQQRTNERTVLLQRLLCYCVRRVNDVAILSGALL